jgi:formyl-CoA transferase
VPSGRVRTIGQVLDDPQLAARQMLLALSLGNETVTVPGNPLHLSDLPPLAASPPPALGQHTDEIRASVKDGTRRPS